MPEYARVCQSMPGYARVCQSMPEYARVCQSMPEYDRVYQSMPVFFLQKHKVGDACLHRAKRECKLWVIVAKL